MMDDDHICFFMICSKILSTTWRIIPYLYESGIFSRDNQLCVIIHDMEKKVLTDDVNQLHFVVSDPIGGTKVLR